MVGLDFKEKIGNFSPKNNLLRRPPLERQIHFFVLVHTCPQKKKNYKKMLCDYQKQKQTR